MSNDEININAIVKKIKTNYYLTLVALLLAIIGVIFTANTAKNTKSMLIPERSVDPEGTCYKWVVSGGAMPECRPYDDANGYCLYPYVTSSTCGE